MAYRLKMVGMPLHDGIEVNCKKGTTTDFKAQVDSKWVKDMCWIIVGA